MARIRTIKPEFWSSTKVGRVSRDSRLLFLGLLNEADDEGRLIGQPKRLAGIVFPYDEDVDSKAIVLMIDELATAGLLVRYEVGGAIYLAICGFSEHQKIDKRQASRLPPPPSAEKSEIPPEQSAEPADCLAEPAEQMAEPAEKLVLDLGSRIRERDLGNGNGKGEGMESNRTHTPPIVPDLLKVAWARWEGYYLERHGIKIGAIAAETELMRLSGLGDKAIRDIDFSISKNAKSILDSSNDFQSRRQEANARASPPTTFAQQRLKNTQQAMEDFLNG